MPILAAPLVIPFAEAVGISIATLGMAKGADMVNDYIQENPEQSAMILKTLVPNLGIGEIFMSKEKESEDDLEVEDDGEEKKKSKKEIVLGELGKEKGNYSDPEAEGAYESKRGRIIKALEDAGKIRKGPDPNYDPSKKFQGYKKFIRRRRADGGSIGIEVLFREKKNLGGLLTGQAKSIYDNMTAAGYFTEDEIRNAITNAGYEIPGASSPETTAPNIIGAQLNQGGGGGRMTGLQETFTKDLSQDPRFNYLEPTAQANKYRFDRSVEPREGLMGFYDRTKNFFAENKFFQPKVRGTLGTRIANQPRLPLPGAIAAYSMSPFNPDSRNFNPLLEGQLNFLELGDNLIGRDPNTGGLKYGLGSVLSGKNVISGFGTNNYETALRNFISKMNANKRISTERKTARLAAAEAELKAIQEKQAQDMRARQADTTRRARELNPDVYARAEQLGFIDKDTGGFKSAGTNENFSNKTGRGRTGYLEGGLASMFVEKK